MSSIDAAGLELLRELTRRREQHTGILDTGGLRLQMTLSKTASSFKIVQDQHSRFVAWWKDNATATMLPHF